MADNDVVTLEDCKTIVNNYLNSENFDIKNVTVRPFFDHVNGFLGEHLLLQIETNDQQLRFFLKRFPHEHVMQRDFLLSMNGWQREIYYFDEFLKNIANTLPNYQLDFVPQFLLGKPNDIVVFEDLTLRGYGMSKMPSDNLLDDQHICLVLASLAKLHAGSLAYEEYKSKELGQCFRLFTGKEDLAKESLIRKEEGFLGYDFVKAAQKGLSALINKVHESCEVSLEEVQEKYQILVENSLQLMFPHNKFRCVLAHGDLWVKNVMYHYKHDSMVPTHAILVDFQLTRYNVPVHDVLLFISLTTNQEVRKNKFHFYLNYYYDHLKQELSNVNIDADEIQMSYDDFLRSVHFIMPEIKFQGPLQRLQQCGNKDFYTKLLKDAEAFKQFIFGDKTPFALDLFETDDNFRSLLTEAVEELIEASLYPDVFREDCYRILENEFGHAYDLEKFKVVKKDDLFELEMEVLVDEKKKIMKYLVKSEDFVRVVKKL
ncbi:unnamed protein product [Ceutorhynchus assimilis]|uniref:CHK kinase-like domain-containing protein n=1 Tax=Ceutorhynchus assimilis TaxID=467358 RepID=A0A9N9MRL3_9CUCU|nr:unnamed protein product [Ceutorhynchus assimilis]